MGCVSMWETIGADARKRTIAAQRGWETRRTQAAARRELEEIRTLVGLSLKFRDFAEWLLELPPHNAAALRGISNFARLLDGRDFVEWFLKQPPYVARLDTESLVARFKATI